MKITAISLALTLASVVLPVTPARAGDPAPVFVEAMAMPAKKPFTIKPGKAYVLIRSDYATALMLMRVPSADDSARYAEFHQAEFVKAQKKFTSRMKAYERDRAAGVKAEKPIEPIEENFVGTPFEMMANVSIGPLFRFSKEKDGSSSYLMELTPGEYRIYGPVYLSTSGLAGTCFCMGSVKFEARAGEITDMGYIPVKSRIDAAVKSDKDDSSAANFPAAEAAPVPAPADLPLDPRLVGLPMRAAEYRPVGKLPNFFGITVGRIPAMPGVIGYDRDRIIDLTGAPSAE